VCELSLRRQTTACVVAGWICVPTTAPSSLRVPVAMARGLTAITARESQVRDLHASRVACQSCHIPRFAKDVPTELARDWQSPVLTAGVQRPGWLGAGRHLGE